MGSIDAYKTKAGTRYKVRYRKPDHSAGAKGGFETKREATRWLAEVEVTTARGEYIDPGASRITISSLGSEWLHSREPVLKASTYRTLESSWRLHVEPHWGARAVGSIRHSEVQAWVSVLSKSLSATTVLRAHGALASILDAAVKDRRLSRNVARGLTLPRKGMKPKAYLSHTQVRLLANSSNHPDLVLFLAYTGLRWGEATGLRVRNVDTSKRRVMVEENAVMVSGAIVLGTPKTHEARSVPFPAFLTTDLLSLVQGKGHDGILFGNGATHMRLPNSVNGWFASAVRKAQLLDSSLPRVTPHDLRHTAASLAVSAGANVKAVQRMLGHASAAMTLDRYADLFDDDLDDVSARLNAQAVEVIVSDSCPIPEK